MDKGLFKKCVECIKCPLCDKPISLPKRLPCNHDICQACLNNHIIRTVPMSGRDIMEYAGEIVPEAKPVNETFVCPVTECKTEIKPRNPKRPTYDWAKQFENNLPLLSILQLCSNSCSNYSVTCDNCHNLSWEVGAKRVCFTCKMKMCLKCEVIHRELNTGHSLWDVSGLNQFSEVVSNRVHFESKQLGYAQVRKDHFRLCKIHKPCRVDMICLTCMEDMCKKCCEHKHRDCKNISNLYQLSENLKIDDVARKSRNTLETSRERCLGRLAEFISMLETLKMGPVKREDGQPSDSEKGDNDVLSTDKQPLKTLVHSLSSSISRCEYLAERVQGCLSDLSAQKPYNSAGDSEVCCVLKCQRLCVELDIQINETENTVVEMRKLVNGYFQNSTKCSELKEENTLGFEFPVGKLDWPQHIRKKIPDESESVKLLKTFDMKSHSDTSECWLTDCTFLSESNIVAVDNANMKLKLVDAEGHLREISLRGKPWSVSSDNSNIVCLTLPDLCSIDVFEIGNTTNCLNGVKAVRTISTKAKCYAISYIDFNLIVSMRCGSRNIVAILNEEGVVLNEIPLEPCINIRYIGTSNFDDKLHVVLSTSNNGLIQFQFEQCDLRNDKIIQPIRNLFSEYPVGVDFDDQGRVVYCSNNTCTVRSCAAGDQSKETILIKGLMMPRAMHFHKRYRQIAVTLDSGNKQNCVLVYGIKQTSAVSPAANELHPDE